MPCIPPRLVGLRTPGLRPVQHLLPLLAAALLWTGCADPSDEPADVGAPNRALAAEVEAQLTSDLDRWYPRVIDSTFGGYLSNFTADWRQMDEQEKFVVTQARHVWTLSRMAERYPERAPAYRAYAAHGVDFLQTVMWDSTYGGFYQTVTRPGEPIEGPGGTISKSLYGNAFALYALSAYYRMSGEPEALDLARASFAWLEAHAHDAEHGGYFQPIARDGTPTRTGYPKDYNSGIHMLEALAELYAAWPDDLVRERLEENFYLVRDTMTARKGYLRLYFDAAWNHLSFADSSETAIRANLGRDHVTPGHDIETAFLLLESAHALGMDGDPETHRIAKLLTDHTLEEGYDHATGGVYDAGYYFSADSLTITRATKEWWGQAEALHTLAIMADLYPDDPHDYAGTFERQWAYITTYLLDADHGGWYDHGLDASPGSRDGRKSQIWKGNYHTVRSLAGTLDQLNGRSEF